MASAARAGDSLNVNPLIQAILQSALSGAGGGGDPTLGVEGLRGDLSPLAGPGFGGPSPGGPVEADLGNRGPGGDLSLQTMGGGHYIDSRMQYGIKGVPGPGGDAIWGFNGTVDPFGEVKFG